MIDTSKFYLPLSLFKLVLFISILLLGKKLGLSDIEWVMAPIITFTTLCVIMLINTQRSKIFVNIIRPYLILYSVSLIGYSVQLLYEGIYEISNSKLWVWVPVTIFGTLSIPVVVELGENVQKFMRDIKGKSPRYILKKMSPQIIFLTLVLGFYAITIETTFKPATYRAKFTNATSPLYRELSNNHDCNSTIDLTDWLKEQNTSIRTFIIENMVISCFQGDSGKHLFYFSPINKARKYHVRARCIDEKGAIYICYKDSIVSCDDITDLPKVGDVYEELRRLESNKTE